MDPEHARTTGARPPDLAAPLSNSARAPLYRGTTRQAPLRIFPERRNDVDSTVSGGTASTHVCSTSSPVTACETHGHARTSTRRNATTHHKQRAAFYTVGAWSYELFWACQTARAAQDHLVVLNDAASC